MKKWRVTICGVLAVIFVIPCAATTHYVDLNSSNPTSPFTGWSSAATNIQDAIDAADPGDQILVTNGIYRTGGKIMAGDLTNRIALDKAVTVQSVNGPWLTIIQGGATVPGNSATRCAWLTNGAVLNGFTIQAGATRDIGDFTNLENGGGVWCFSSNATVLNCVIKSNVAANRGNAVYRGTIRNSILIQNLGFASGTAAEAILYQSTVISNLNTGVFQCVCTNCIVFANTVNSSGTKFAYSCTTPLASGPGNISSAPQLYSDAALLTATSPCIGAGTDLGGGTDIIGRGWSNPPSMGCYEWQPSPSIVIQPSLHLTNNPIGFFIGNVSIIGQSPYSFYWLKNGAPIQDDGHFQNTQTSNLTAIGVVYEDAAAFQLVISNAYGMATSAVAQVVFHVVDPAGNNPIAPYSTWATAATNIQDAITAAATGEIVLVTNGLYSSGGKSMDAVITNRVSINKAILVQSVNGPQSTIIQGAWDPTSVTGPAAIRCAWLTNNSILSGFTLRSGATRPYPGGFLPSTFGGGVWGSASSAIVHNCVITGNVAANGGGGAYNVKLISCLVCGNKTPGDGNPGTSSGQGGGAATCAILNCVLWGNSAHADGGGAYSCNATNCTFSQNTAAIHGSGAYQGSLINCTLTGNVGSQGVSSATLFNSIIWNNTNSSGTIANYQTSTFTSCDTDPLPTGNGNLDTDPLLLADGYHIQESSPCRGAGTNKVVVSVDIDDQSWSNPPSIGCDEWQPQTAIGTLTSFAVVAPGHLAINVTAAGRPPFHYFWSKDGTSISADANHPNPDSPSLLVNNFGPADAGNYQVVASNDFGSATRQIAAIVIHTVNAAGSNPTPPYSAWATAATNIQDAIDAASAGDIVLVTNGVYATGGKIKSGDLVNRVAVDKALTTVSVNGYANTSIQGAWDPTTTNGPLAIRCTWLTDGATLMGFTLCNGATRASSGPIGATAESGGGIWATSSNAIVSDCLLSNNAAIYGGGIAVGTLNNSLVVSNNAVYGGGAFRAVLNNCTVVGNRANYHFTISHHGGGTCEGITRNSIVLGNVGETSFFTDNAGTTGPSDSTPSSYFYSDTTGTISGSGNLSATPQFYDLYHFLATSPCRSAGNPQYVIGYDFDGHAWSNSPSMGCAEVDNANFVGPLMVSLSVNSPYILVQRPAAVVAMVQGKPSNVQWTFDSGPITTNTIVGTNFIYSSFHWSPAGDYNLRFTAFNNDNPDGVSTNILIHVYPLSQPQLNMISGATNGLAFQFDTQPGGKYTVQFTTNLLNPASWQTVNNIGPVTGGVFQVTGLVITNDARFYRIQADASWPP